MCDGGYSMLEYRLSPDRHAATKVAALRIGTRVSFCYLPRPLRLCQEFGMDCVFTITSRQGGQQPLQRPW